MEPTSQRGPGALRPDDGRLVRGRRSRQRIRAAARELFRERGFDGATLRAIAARAGMGASSIYRHVRTKEELLVQELADLQEEAWTRFRTQAPPDEPCRDAVRRFFDAQHELLARDPDLTVIALRATTYDKADLARHVLALHDRSIGLLAELLLAGRSRGDLRRDCEVLAAAQALFHTASGARLSWANGRLSEEGCRRAIDVAVTLLFRGIGADAAAGH